MFNPGDLITGKRSATTWRVLKVGSNGWLYVRFERGKRLPGGKTLIKVIKRPEEFRRI